MVVVVFGCACRQGWKYGVTGGAAMCDGVHRRPAFHNTARDTCYSRHASRSRISNGHAHEILGTRHGFRLDWPVYLVKHMFGRHP